VLAQAENITDVSRRGHDFSTQRIRLGVERNGWGAGAAADMTETGNSPKPRDIGWNVGPFVSKKF